jgi:sortase A
VAAWRWTERTLWVAGLVALGLWTGAMVDRHAGAARELSKFTAAKSAVQPLPASATPDLSLWAPERIQAWRDSQKETSPPPLAVLRIPRLGIEAPVIEGTSEFALNRGVGHIEDTPRPGADGNSGIAGHRDGFFRGLKDITAGDVLELETRTSVSRYRVEKTWIVNPDDVSVLDPTGTPAITLVTCYPFYFIGSAPRRFIVRALRTDVMAARAARN